MGKREEIIAWSICWEGSISLIPYRRYAIQPLIAISNTDKSLIDQFRELVGYGYIYTHNRTKETGYNGWNIIHRWQIQSIRDALRLCKEIMPIIPSKVRQLEIVYEFCQLREKKMANRNTRSIEAMDWTREWELKEELSYLNCHTDNQRSKI